MQYYVKIPLTGFIYAYLLSVSAVINIIIFSLVEITLFPLFLGQYIIIQVSQKIRKIRYMIICLMLMIAPYIPYILNLTQLNYLDSFDYITNSNFINNFLMACILLPFQIMIIRILIRLKLWGMKVKTNKTKIRKMFINALGTFILIIVFTVTFVKIYNSTKTEITQQELESIYKGFNIQVEQAEQLGYALNTVVINSNIQVLRYYVELISTDPLPIFDANYPYDILSKPFTAVFNLDEYPPNPLVLTFTSQADVDIICEIHAWVQTDYGIKEVTLQQILRVIK